MVAHDYSDSYFKDGSKPHYDFPLMEKSSNKLDLEEKPENTPKDPDPNPYIGHNALASIAGDDEEYSYADVGTEKTIIKIPNQPSKIQNRKNSVPETLEEAEDIKWVPPNPRKPSEKKIAALRRQKNSDEFREFIERKVFTEYFNDYYTKKKIMAIYPYYLVDLAAAFEDGGEKGGDEVIEEIFRRLDGVREHLLHKVDTDWCKIPDDYSDRIGHWFNQGTAKWGYERHWVQYVDRDDPNFVIEFLWHRHDGGQRPAGTVDLWIERIDRRVAALYCEDTDS